MIKDMLIGLDLLRVWADIGVVVVRKWPEMGLEKKERAEVGGRKREEKDPSPPNSYLQLL